MKREFSILGQKSKEEETKRISFYLEKVDGEIILRAQGEDKNRWAILSISEKTGRLFLYAGLSGDLGLAIDDDYIALEN